MNINILLIYPPVESFFIKTNDVFYGLTPPLGLLYLARMIKDRGHNVEILDFSAETYDEQKIKDAIVKTDVVGITVLSVSVKIVNKIVEIILGEKKNIKIIIGGPHCTLFPVLSLEDIPAHISVQGDGEFAILDILDSFQNKTNISDVKGTYYKDDTEKESQVNIIKNIDSIPFPLHSLVKKYSYGKSYNPNIRKGEFTSIIASRGCPFKCRFCSRNLLSMQKYRARSTDNILEEIVELYRDGYRYIAFSDDCFLSNIKNAHDLFDSIISAEIDMKFIITAARVDSAEKDLYKKMKKAGVTHIQFGLESGNQDVLDFYNKKTTIEQNRYAVKLSNEIGFFTIGSFILGAPFETIKHFKSTVNFAKSLPLESVSFLPLRYMAGSEIWQEAVNQGKINANEYIVEAGSERNLGNMSSKQIENYCIKAQQEYYLRPVFFYYLLKSALKNNDFSFVQSYLSIMYRYVFKGFF